MPKAAKLIGENAHLVDSYPLAHVLTYSKDTDQIACYQNQVMDSGDLGKIILLLIGPDRTFQEAPEHAPDGPHDLGWKYQFVGFFDKERNKLADEEPLQSNGPADLESVDQRRADSAE